MRIQLALGLSLGVMLSYTAENAAYGVSGEGNVSGTATLGTATSATSESTSGSGSGSDSNSSPNPISETDNGSTLSGSGTEGITTGIATDTRSEARCWSTPIFMPPTVAFRWVRRSRTFR